MTISEIREIAKNLGIKPGKLKKGDLIRKIQEVEGNIPCYETARRDSCGEEHCLWRPDCT